MSNHLLQIIYKKLAGKVKIDVFNSVLVFKTETSFSLFQESNWWNGEACHNTIADGKCQKLRAQPRAAGDHQRRNWTLVVRRVAGWLSGIRLEIRRERFELGETWGHAWTQRGTCGAPCPFCQVSSNSIMNSHKQFKKVTKITNVSLSGQI